MGEKTEKEVEEQAEKQEEKADVQPIYIDSDLRTPYGVLLLIEMIIGILGEALALGFFLSASCRLYGRETNIVGSLWFVIDIFDLSQDRFYRILACAAVGVVFFVFAVLMAKNLVKTVMESSKVFRLLQNKDDRDFGYIYAKRILSYGMNTYALFGIFGVLCTLAGGNVILSRMIPVFIIFGFFYLLQGWIFAYHDFDSPNLKEIITDSCRDLIFIAGISLLFLAIKEPALRNISNGLTMLLYGGAISSEQTAKVNFNTFYALFLSPVLYAIMAVFFLMMIFNYSFVLGSSTQKDLKKIIMITGSLMLIQQIFKIAMGLGSVSFSSFWRTFINSNYLEIILLYGILFLLEILYHPFRKERTRKTKKVAK